MFTLFRADVLPLTDLGIKEGIMRLYDFKELPTPKQMMEKSKPWQPYRTIASLYL
jgi:3-methyladenine DNA glycosylase/8-oxoguanine DNA glycosylase